MVATQKTIRELAPYLTAFIEVVDARAPLVTRHRPMTRWIGKTPVILVLNKSELAAPDATRQWQQFFRGLPGIAGVCSLTATNPGANRVLRAVISRTVSAPYRIAVVGLPNVGKSTLLNRMIGRHRARTGAKPGLTRGPQWIRLEDGWEWLDLPGVVTPSHTKDWRLQALGVVPVPAEALYDCVEALWQRLHPEDREQAWLEWGKDRGYLGKGAVVDEHRTAMALLGEFQKGGLGRTSLEAPDDLDKEATES